MKTVISLSAPQKSTPVKPDICLKLEKALGIKFKGPFSDMREWDAVIKTAGITDAMLKVGELGKLFVKLGLTKNSTRISVNSTFCLKVDAKTVVAVDVDGKNLQLVVYTD